MPVWSLERVLNKKGEKQMIKVQNIYNFDVFAYEYLIEDTTSGQYIRCEFPIELPEELINQIQECKDISMVPKILANYTDHRKFMRMITVYEGITAPLY